MEEPSLGHAHRNEIFQFDRHGYFVFDRVDQEPGKLLFNLAVGLKGS
ncbi:hypothetical protein [Acidovorax sp. A1169]